MMSSLIVAVLAGVVQTADHDTANRVPRSVSPTAVTADGIGQFADEYFNRMLVEKQSTGAAFVFVANGRVIASRGYGEADREQHMRVDPERTEWRLASTSKSLTALAVLRLVERGQVRLDADVNDYLRAFKVPEAFGAPITVRELLLHTSGLDDRLMGDGFVAGTPPSLTEVMARRLPRRIRPPGTFLYGNYDYGLLGAVVEAVTGMPFVAFMHDSVLGPIGMRDATFEQPVPSSVAAMLARPYRSAGASRPWPVVYHQSSPGGGATASGADMGRLLTFLLEGDTATQGTLVSRRSVRDAFGLDGLTDTTFFNEGFGWRSRLWNGERIVETGGDLPGYNNIVVLFPERHLGFWIAINSGRSAATLGFLWAFLDTYFPHAPPSPYANAERTRSLPNESFVGTYRPARYPHFELSKLGILSAETRVETDADGALHYWGQRWTRVGPLAYQRAGGQLASGPLVTTFGLDANGAVSTFENMERIPWYERQAVQLALAVFFFVAFIAFAFALRHDFVAIAPLANVAFLLGIVAILSTMPSYALMLGYTPALRAVLLLPLLSLGVTAWYVSRVMRMRTLGSDRAPRRMRGTLFLGTSALFIVWLNHWNLLGYRS